MFYWLLKYVVLGPLLKLVFRPQVTGLRNVPSSGPVILACNHLSFSDSIFTPLMVDRRVTFVAKAEYFTGKGLKGWLMRQFFSGTGTVPVDRSGGQAAQAALDTLLNVLREGGVAGIYPEGTRSPDGRLYRGKTGVARLVLESGAVVVPVALLNTDEIMYELMALSGREYVDLYAGSLKTTIEHPTRAPDQGEHPTRTPGQAEHRGGA